MILRRLGGTDAPQRYVAVVLKVLVQPVLAYVLGRYGLALSGTPLLAAVSSGLPSAQNIYVYLG